MLVGYVYESLLILMAQDFSRLTSIFKTQPIKLPVIAKESKRTDDEKTKNPEIEKDRGSSSRVWSGTEDHIKKAHNSLMQPK